MDTTQCNLISSGEKIFILDTSVWMHDPCADENFANNHIVVPIWVVEELDKLKRLPNGRGWCAREASRRIDSYFSKGPFTDGAQTNGGGRISLAYKGHLFKDLPLELENNNDNKILATAMSYKEKSGKKVVVVSKDCNMRLKASALDLYAEDYLHDKIPSKNAYSGIMELDMSDELYAFFISNTEKPNGSSAKKVFEFLDEEPILFPNQCCIFFHAESGEKILTIYKSLQGIFSVVKPVYSKERVVPINDEQKGAYALLSDPSIWLITMTGKPGSGKTLLSLNVALSLTPIKYSEVLVYRPTIEMGEPMGHLPGNEEEKFAPWQRPIIDNMRVILGDQNIGKNGNNVDFEQCLFIEPINFIRGRSLHNAFIIVDDAQNFTPHQVRTLIGRVGKNSKIVFEGDPNQIDNPFLDSQSNGLSYLVDGLRSQELTGHISLRTSERSSEGDIILNALK